MVGILVSFRDGLFSGTMLVSGRVLGGGFKHFWTFHPENLGKMNPPILTGIFFRVETTNQVMIVQMENPPSFKLGPFSIASHVRLPEALSSWWQLKDFWEFSP